MHAHHKALADAIQTDRLAAAARRRPPAHGGELERIVRAAANGDAGAWDRLTKRFATHVHNAARATGLTHHDAEDAAQATWLRLFRHLPRLRDPRSLPGWLATTARREALRLHRRAPREEPLGDELARAVPVAADHDHRLMAAARREAIALALCGLPERHRALMHALIAEPAPTYADVAARLGIPIGSIGPIRGQCLTRLRRHPDLRELLDLDD
jgi:RNA polymerase sigma factor (sigma-70 family)